MIKIIDFGTALRFEQGEMKTNMAGTYAYIAPEVLNKRYNEKCDMWSVGVIAYTLLCG
jgi:calcium-dependent protein kinase